MRDQSTYRGARKAAARAKKIPWRNVEQDNMPIAGDLRRGGGVFVKTVEATSSKAARRR